MNEGVRVHHLTEVDTVVAIVDRRRKLAVPLLCNVCEDAWHKWKTYHIKVNADGDAVVSHGIREAWERMGVLGRPHSPFVIDSTVDNPPPQVVGFGRNGSHTALTRRKNAPHIAVHYDYMDGDRPPGIRRNG